MQEDAARPLGVPWVNAEVFGPFLSIAYIGRETSISPPFLYPPLLHQPRYLSAPPIPQNAAASSLVFGVFLLFGRVGFASLGCLIVRWLCGFVCCAMVLLCFSKLRELRCCAAVRLCCCVAVLLQ